MTLLVGAVDHVLKEQKSSKKPLAIVLAGHNGSGKSTMWYKHLADQFQIPLINADRMMLSILPEVAPGDKLPGWASSLRDEDKSWMKVAQQGVQAFVVQAMANKVPFAMETVFSHWQPDGNGGFESKIDLIKDMQAAGYYVILFFVGLSNVQLSMARVSTRVAEGGHNVDGKKLIERFPRTQNAIKLASSVADSAILVDNSRESSKAFTVCRIQMLEQEVFDLRNNKGKKSPVVLEWLNVVNPRE